MLIEFKHAITLNNPICASVLFLLIVIINMCLKNILEVCFAFKLVLFTRLIKVESSISD